MNFDPRDCRVSGDREVHLKKWATTVKPLYGGTQSYESLLQGNIQELSKQQQLLYASRKHAILIVFQGMDTAGKDGAVQHVMSGVNPQGCEVFSFKVPTPEELDHDFLWRTNQRLPARGRIGIFNRSYYEEVVVVRVHPEFLGAQGVDPATRNKRRFWDDRFRSIVNMEDHLYRNGTRLLKFFLHISKGEQRKRLLERIDDPTKNWKFSTGDIEERKLWKAYMSAYGAALTETATESSPWHVIPADDKRNARLMISSIICDALKDLRMTLPKATTARIKELQSIRRRLGK